MAIWNIARGPLEKVILAGIGGLIVGVQSLGLPAEFAWVSAAAVWLLGVLKVLADKIDPAN